MTTGNDLRGAYVALVTPFKNGKVDDQGLKDLVEFQINNGTHGLIVYGTTGESPTLSEEEKNHVLKVVLEAAGGRIPVFAGTGANNTQKALETTKAAAEIGAQASLCVCPYYNKPTQEGIIEHFEFLADEGNLPLILYNIPGRTGVNMTPETVRRLAQHQNIIGVKEASGSMDQASEIISTCPKNFALLSGDDSLTLPILALGGQGVISTTSNVAPRLMADLCNHWFEKNYKRARSIHYQLLPLFKALFIESNPVPAKTALSMMGVISNEIRMPLAILTPEHTEVVRKVISDLGLL